MQSLGDGVPKYDRPINEDDRSSFQEMCDTPERRFSGAYEGELSSGEELGGCPPSVSHISKSLRQNEEQSLP